jgi:hypothetical protein
MLALAQALGFFGGGSPSMVSPAPLPFVVLAWWSPIGPVGVVALAGLLSLAWCTPLVKGQARIPLRTVVLATVVTVSSLFWFVAARLQHLNPGLTAYTVVTATASLLLCSLTALVVYRGRRHPSITASAIAHSTLFVWLFSYAFAWFGEVP